MQQKTKDSLRVGIIGLLAFYACVTTYMDENTIDLLGLVLVGVSLGYFFPSGKSDKT